MTPRPQTLAIDIGGTQTRAALIHDGMVGDRLSFETPSDADPAAWLARIARETEDWRGRHQQVGIAATGLVEGGIWNPLNPRTLSSPRDFPLVYLAQQTFAVPAVAVNDAQAAAWGEYRFGAGKGEDMVFLTISTGIGGGIVTGGKLHGGLAGHFGQWFGETVDSPIIENRVAGRWIAEAARESGRETDARGVFDAAARGEEWARQICAQSQDRVAALCANIQLTLDPDRIVIGGSIGLATGFLAGIDSRLESVHQRMRPTLVAAALGGDAGLIGASDLAVSAFSIMQREETS
jgi:N-acetylmannosamine-6-phosphate 2-epimerase/N-acetylmannosamine kinase